MNRRETGAREHHGARALVATALGAAITACATSAHAWDYFEHRWIGDVACAIAAQRDPTIRCTIESPCEARGKVTFGDLTAAAGDHFEKEADLREALEDWLVHPDVGAIHDIFVARDYQLASVRTWLGQIDPELAHHQLDAPAHFDRASVQEWMQRRALPDLEACAFAAPWLFRKVEARGPDKQKTCPAVDAKSSADYAAWCTETLLALADVARIGDEPDRVRGSCLPADDDELALFSATPKFVTLARHDVSHFANEAVERWETLAWLAADEFDASHEHLFMDEANTQLAFALHFLDDRLSAGHMRTRPASALVASGEVMRAHDYDNSHGLFVRTWVDALVDPAGGLVQPYRWMAFGDRCLFGASAAQHRAIVVLATAAALLKHHKVSNPPTYGLFMRASWPERHGWAARFPTWQDQPNAPVPALPGYLSVRLEPALGISVDGAMNDPAFPGWQAGLTVDTSLVLAPHWGADSWANQVGLEFGFGARLASDELVVLGPLFAQLTLGYVDFEGPEVVKIWPFMLRLGALVARAPTLGEYRFGGEVSGQVRIQPPGRWSVNIGAGAQALADDSVPIGFSGTLGIGAQL